jgi:hypothetical protein
LLGIPRIAPTSVANTAGVNAGLLATPLTPKPNDNPGTFSVKVQGGIMAVNVGNGGIKVVGNSRLRLPCK